MRVSSVVAILALSSVSDAFLVQPRTAIRSKISTTLSAGADAAHIKAAGGGVAIIPPGGKALYDPEKEGRLQGTNNLEERLSKGAQYLGGSGSASSSSIGGDASADLEECQHFLEDIGVPTNFAKPTAPVEATVLGRARLISEDAPGDIQHIVMKLPEGMHYVEGQSISVIPPGIDANGKPHKPRLYSIASTRYGDLLDGNTVSLCVRRAEYFDPVTNQKDDSKKGICSGYLCDIQKGETVKVAGPTGKTMLLPEDPTKDIIMVATGTGIAPFRGFLHRLFMENTVARHMFDANAWLILGVPVTGGLLYPQELDAMQENSKGKLEVTYAISREMKNAAGGKLYVQDVLAERADELFEKLNKGAVIYFCGLKGMMPGILEALERVAASKGIDWNAKLKELKANHQWHVEVY